MKKLILKDNSNSIFNYLVAMEFMCTHSIWTYEAIAIKEVCDFNLFKGCPWTCIYYLKKPIFPYQGTQQHIPIFPQLLVTMSNKKINFVINFIFLMNCIFPKERVCLRGEIKY
jgi:hypothetical protein